MAHNLADRYLLFWTEGGNAVADSSLSVIPLRAFRMKADKLKSYEFIVFNNVACYHYQIRLLPHSSLYKFIEKKNKYK
jgi:hypothetical protein